MDAWSRVHAECVRRRLSDAMSAYGVQLSVVLRLLPAAEDGAMDHAENALALGAEEARVAPLLLQPRRHARRARRLRVRDRTGMSRLGNESAVG